jgi:aminopeptidase N
MPISGHHACCAAANRGSFVLPGTVRQYERSLPYTFLHLHLDVRVDLKQHALTGVATLQVRRAAPGPCPLVLDAVALDVREVRVSSGEGGAVVNAPRETVAFENDGKELVIHMPDVAPETTTHVVIKYTAKPKRGLYFFGKSKSPQSIQAWSQCQDEDARHWFPCHDKPHVKTPFSARFQVPAGFDVLSNGERTSDSTKGRLRTVTFELKEPLPSYLVTLVVGHFERVRDRDAVLPSGRRVPVEYWVPKGKIQDAKRAFNQTPRMIELFSKLTQVEYPYSRYTQIVVSEFIFGGMENTTASTMYEHILLDARAALDIESHDLVAHELAHQWFGDWVTCQDWPHAWLNEGFATFFELVELEDRLGEDEYYVALERDHGAYVGEVSERYSRPVVSREYDEPIDLFDRHLYQKGGLVLHLLRQELGADTFWRSVGRYLRTHGTGHATTDALRAAFTAESGQSLERFFDEWIMEAIHPVVKVKTSWEHGQVLVRFHQTHRRPMDLVCEVEIRDASGNLHRLKKHSGTDAHTTLSLPLKERPSYVAIDPNFKLLGQTVIETPFDLVQGQLQHGSTARIKRQACALLAKSTDFRAIEALAKLLHDNKQPWMNRTAAARALGKLRNATSFAHLKTALRDREPRLRAAVAQALGNFRTKEAARALTPLLKSEPSYLVAAATTRALGETRQEETSAQLVRQLSVRSWGEVVSAAACEALATLGLEPHVDALQKQTAPSVATKARRAAILALGRFGTFPKVIDHLEVLLADPHPHVRMDVVAALKRCGTPPAINLLRRALQEETDARTRRKLREALRDIETDSNLTALQDRVGRLERQIDDLLNRQNSTDALLRNVASSHK